MLPEGSLAVSWSHNEPYLRGSIIAYPFNWMEASFQYTDINNTLYSQVSEFSGSQSLKDKSFDLKIRLNKESAIFPQLAIGFRDIGGTALFASEYIVASKRILQNLDISVGLGWGVLSANRISNPLSNFSKAFENRVYDQGLGGKLSLESFFRGDTGVFGGIEYTLPNFKGLRFKAEIDGTNYDIEGPKSLTRKSKYNFGFVYPISRNFFIKLSQTRGNQINFGFNYKLELGDKKTLVGKKSEQQNIENSKEIRFVTNKSDENLYRASLLYLSKNGINLQKATVNDESLDIAISQSRYRMPAVSVGRTVRILDQISPEKIKNFNIIQINGGIGVLEANVNRETFNHYMSLELPQAMNDFIELAPNKYSDKDFIFNPRSDFPAIFNSLAPEIRSQIGGPDGFFFGDLKLNLDSEILFSRNLSLITKISYGIFDNMDELKLPSDSILPHVRTDIVQYLKQSRDFSITRMQLNYWGQISPSLFYKVSGGIFESMFSGYGFEVLYKPFYKNYGFGVEVWDVVQRDYDQMFSSLDYKTLTGHATFYLHEPNSKILFKLKGGRYLAKDSGFTFDASRVFKNGLRMGVFFSLTDISAEEFGEGSFDKGFYFWVPIDLFTQSYTRRTFGWGLRPITRDGAQSLVHGYPLWGVVDSSSDYNFRKNIQYLYD